MFIIILSIIIIVIVLFLVFLIFRHLPDLKNLDPDSILEEKQSKARAKILQARLSRRGSEVRGKIDELMTPQKNFLINQFTKIKNKVVTLEEKYQKTPKKKSRPLSISDLFLEAEELIKKDDFTEAEKTLIQIIAKDQKNIQAYEKLTDVYMATKNYSQGEEIIKYLIRLLTVKNGSYKKLDLISLSNEQLLEAEMDFLKSFGGDNKVAKYYIILSEIYESTDRDEKAIDCVLRAASIEPNNTKYLDKLIDISIRIKDVGLAKKIYKHLKKINPENGKLDAWKESIEKI